MITRLAVVALTTVAWSTWPGCPDSIPAGRADRDAQAKHRPLPAARE